MNMNYTTAVSLRFRINTYVTCTIPGQELEQQCLCVTDVIAAVAAYVFVFSKTTLVQSFRKRSILC